MILLLLIICFCYVCVWVVYVLFSVLFCFLSGIHLFNYHSAHT